MSPVDGASATVYGVDMDTDDPQAVADAERDRIVAFLEAEAASWLETYQAGGGVKHMTVAWRNHAAYSSAAAKIRANRHRQP